MNAIPDVELEGFGREKRLERILYSLKGERVRAADLLHAVGLCGSVVDDREGSQHIRPHTAWIEFVNLRIRVERFFSDRGFVLRKTGGSPFDEIWLEPHSASS